MDGAQLAELMFDYGVGVSTANSYVVKRIDSDVFEDETVGEMATQATAK
jgi:restriction endonuclease Mrr